MTSSPYPLPVSKPRPSKWWFVVGGALLVAAVVVGVSLFIWALSGFLRTDATVPADGRVHQVSVDTGGDRFLWFQEDSSGQCSIRDTATGAEVELRPVSGQYTRSSGDDNWVANSRFDPGTGDLEITCTGSGGSVEIGPALKISGFIGGIFAAILLPMALAGAGLIVLLITGVLYLTRPATPRQP